MNSKVQKISPNLFSHEQSLEFNNINPIISSDNLDQINTPDEDDGYIEDPYIRGQRQVNTPIVNS